jgi:hypothetical protein
MPSPTFANSSAGKKADAKTIGGWRDKFIRLRGATEETKRGDRADVEIFNRAVLMFFPEPLRLLMGEKPNKRDARAALRALSAVLKELN